MRDPSKQQVDQNSIQWNNVSYKLQTMTGRSQLKIVKLFKYPRKIQKIKYENKEKIDSLIDITDFKAQYRNKVVNHYIPLEDVIFICGHVNLNKYCHQRDKIFHFLMCKVELGTIGKFPDNNNRANSMLISPQNQSQPYHFNFLLNDHSQYQVKYEISFIIGQEGEAKQKQTICSMCQNNLATTYCRDQKMHFCDDCCSNHHYQMKKNYEIQMRQHYQNEFRKKNINKKSMPATIAVPNIAPHQLQDLNRINTLPLCESHSIKNQYYCLKCEKYVCNICIQKGLHYQNPQHAIKHIEYLYEEKQEVNQTLCSKRKQKVETLLGNIQSISKLITQNYQNIRKKIISQFQQALAQLQTLYINKITQIHSDQIQLHMIYQQLQWSQAFIQHQQKYLKPLHYFKLQTRYQQQIEDIKINAYDESFRVKPDLDYFFYWHVGTKQDQEIKDIKRMKQNGTSSQANLTPTNAQSNLKKDGKYNSLVRFDSRSQAPKRGQLSLLLQNSNLHIFKFKSSKRGTP